MELLGASQSAGQFLVSNPDSAGSRTTYVKPPLKIGLKSKCFMFNNTHVILFQTFLPIFKRFTIEILRDLLEML